MKFIVDLDLDGYSTEEEMEQACIAFIEESLDFSASSVSVSKYEENGWMIPYYEIRCSLIPHYIPTSE